MSRVIVTKNTGGDGSSGTAVSQNLSRSKGHEVAVFRAITASNLLFALSWRSETPLCDG